MFKDQEEEPLKKTKKKNKKRERERAGRRKPEEYKLSKPSV